MCYPFPSPSPLETENGVGAAFWKELVEAAALGSSSEHDLAPSSAGALSVQHLEMYLPLC